jgi:glycosyltransferase involved in cell wall biosynthesis
MDVLHVCYEYPGVTANCGGGGRVVDVLDSALAERGHDSRVLTDAADGHWATFPVRTLAEQRRAIQQVDPDVVHGHFAVPSALALPALVPDDTPLVVTTMGADVYDPSRFDRLRPLADRAVGHVLDAADAVVAPSEDLQARIERKWGLDARRIPHAIDTSAWNWQPRERPTEPTVVTVARLVERKQLLLGIEAVRRWRDREQVMADYRLIGDGPQREDLEDCAARHDWVDVAGYVDDLDAALRDADLFLLPSGHEAFGIALLEALAAGLPCVVTDTGGQTDVVSDDVGYTAPPHADALAAGLDYVFENYQAFQAATEDYVEQWYSAERLAEDYVALYDDLTASRRRRDRSPSAHRQPPAY